MAKILIRKKYKMETKEKKNFQNKIKFKLKMLKMKNERESRNTHKTIFINIKLYCM